MRRGARCADTEEPQVGASEPPHVASIAHSLEPAPGAPPHGAAEACGVGDQHDVDAAGVKVRGQPIEIVLEAGDHAIGDALLGRDMSLVQLQIEFA